MIITTTSHSLFHVICDCDSIGNIVLGFSSIIYVLYWTFLLILDIYFARMIIFYALILFEEDIKIMRSIKLVVGLSTGVMLVFDSSKIIKYLMFTFLDFSALQHIDMPGMTTTFQYVVTIDMYITAI